MEPFTRAGSGSPGGLDPPSAFRGGFLRGEEAAAAASLVSGPFHARPTAYAAPVDGDDLRLLVRWAAGEGIALIARGAGTGMPGGNLGPALVVSLGEGEGFREVEAIGAAGKGRADAAWEGRIRAGAGAVAVRIDEAARAEGRFLPPLPSSARWCSAGGMAANNAAGARSFRFGAASEWISAIEGVDARGEPFRFERGRPATGGPRRLPMARGRGPAASPALQLAGFGPNELTLDEAGLPAGWPRVRKNASGYALDRFVRTGDLLDLFIGSEGTLGILTAVEWRTAPLPPSRGVAILPARSPAEVVAIAFGAAEIGATACEFLGRRFLEVAHLAGDPRLGPLLEGEANALLCLEVDGAADEVHAKLARAGELGRDVAGPGIRTSEPDEAVRLWAVRHAASPIIARAAERGTVSTQFIEDSVVPVARLGDYLTGLDEILAEAGFDAVVFGHAGDGNVHVNPLVDVEAPDWEPRVRTALDGVVALVSELGGTLAGEHGDGRLRAPFLDTIWGAPTTSAFRSVKRHFDPEGLLNPGVILPLPGQDPLEGFRPRRVPFPERVAGAGAGIARS